MDSDMHNYGIHNTSGHGFFNNAIWSNVKVET